MIDPPYAAILPSKLGRIQEATRCRAFMGSLSAE
jgi:hypothetical protein